MGRKAIGEYIPCEYCGIEKYYSPSAVKRSKHHYCNNSCQLKDSYKTGRRNKLSITSKANKSVGENGFPQKKGKKIPHLHNKENYKKVSIAKKGKPILKLRGKNHPNWKGGKKWWEFAETLELKKLVRKRDNLKCVKCGKTEDQNIEETTQALTVDHIIPYRYSRNNSVKNMQLLCSSCHGKKQIDDRKYLKMI